MSSKHHSRYRACGALFAPVLFWPLAAHADEQTAIEPRQASAANFASSNPNLNEWTLIGLTESDATSAGDALGVKVAVLDGRTDCRNTALAGHCVNYGINGGTYTNYDSHGTHVAGIVGANPFGVASAATILNFGVYADSGWVATGTALSDAWKSALSAGAQITSMSFGCPHTALCFSSYDLSTIASGTLPMLFVKAAGNEGSALSTETTSVNAATALAALNKTLIVGSASAAGSISSFSNRPGSTCLLAAGATTCTEDLRWRNHFLVAPGENIYSTLPNGGFGSMSGTSMATPVVAGAAALLQARWPALKNAPETLARILLTSATDLGAPGVDDVYGYGLLNVANAFVATGTITIVSTSGTTTPLTPTSPTTSKGRARKTSVSPGTFGGLEAALGSVTVFDQFGRDFRLDQTAAVEFQHTRPGLSILRSRRLLGAFTQDSWASRFFASAPSFRSFASFSPLSGAQGVTMPEQQTLRAGVDVPLGAASVQLRLSGSSDVQADFAYDPSLRPLGFFASTDLASNAVISNVTLSAGRYARLMFYAMASVDPVKAQSPIDLEGPFLRNQVTTLSTETPDEVHRSHRGVGIGYWKRFDGGTLVGLNLSAAEQRNGYLDLATNLPGFDRPTTLLNLGAVVSHAAGAWDLTASGEVTRARMSARDQAIGFTPATFASAQIGVAKSKVFAIGGGGREDSVRVSLVVPPRATSGSLRLGYVAPTADGLGARSQSSSVALGRLGFEPARAEAGYQVGRQGAWSIGFTAGADLEKSDGPKRFEGLVTLNATLR